MKCETCRYWERAKLGDIRERYGFCHRYPPEYKNGTDSVFPPTKEKDWCGEWEKDMVQYEVRKPNRKQDRLYR